MVLLPLRGGAGPSPLASAPPGGAAHALQGVFQGLLNTTECEAESVIVALLNSELKKHTADRTFQPLEIIILPVNGTLKPQACRFSEIKDLEVLNCEYGKNTIKFLRLHKEGKKQFVKEVEVCAHLRLTSPQEYLEGNNSLVIPTDTIKNIVLVLAKKNGISSLEQFAIDICNHFMTTFCQVAYVKAYVQEVPWQRLHEDGVPHIHSFICVPDGIRFCEAEQCRNGPLIVFAGIKDLKLMKTTQSGFEGFYKNEHTTLPERHDRILCGEFFCKWSYGECKDFDFNCIWKKIRECILEAFAGPPDCGEYSPSYQKTVNCIQMLVLSRVPQVQVIEVVLNNTFYNVVDMKNLGLTNDKEVLVPVETPYGSCTCTLGRKTFFEAQSQMLRDERRCQFGQAAAQGN